MSFIVIPVCYTTVINRLPVSTRWFGKAGRHTLS